MDMHSVVSGVDVSDVMANYEMESRSICSRLFLTCRRIGFQNGYPDIVFWYETCPVTMSRHQGFSPMIITLFISIPLLFR